MQTRRGLVRLAWVSAGAALLVLLVADASVWLPMNVVVTAAALVLICCEPRP